MQLADSENGGIGEGYNNLTEFALGMNPALSDAGSNVSAETWTRTGSRSSTSAVRTILSRGSYLLIDSTNRVNSSIHTNAQDQLLVGDAVGDYEPVTNRYRIEESVRFIQLMIQQEQETVAD